MPLQWKPHGVVKSTGVVLHCWSLFAIFMSPGSLCGMCCVTPCPMEIGFVAECWKCSTGLLDASSVLCAACSELPRDYLQFLMENCAREKNPGGFLGFFLENGEGENAASVQQGRKLITVLSVRMFQFRHRHIFTRVHFTHEYMRRRPTKLPAMD